jgi:hypothetical protein
MSGRPSSTETRDLSGQALTDAPTGAALPDLRRIRHKPFVRPSERVG